MSDSVIRLRIDSKEFDANVKRAGEALSKYFSNVCREAGETLESLDEGVLEAVQALGEMGTKADTTKGALRELTQTTADMTVAYRSLTDEEKNSPLGQALQQSIAQLTERAGQMRDAMDDVQASIQNAASDTRTFDQLAQGVNVATAGIQGLTGAGKLLGIEMGNDVEVIAKLQAAMAVTNSLTTIQTALQKQSALMQGVQAVQAAAATAAQTAFAGATGAATVAQAAFNAVANANPYVLLATAIGAVVGAIGLFSSSTKEASDTVDDQSKKLDNLGQALDRLKWKYDNLIAVQEAMGRSSDQLKAQQLDLEKQQYSKKFNDALASGDTDAANEARQKMEEIGRQILDIQRKKEDAAKVTQWFIDEKDFINTRKEINAAISHFKQLQDEVGIGSKKFQEYQRYIDEYTAKLPKSGGSRGGGGGSKGTATTEKDEMSLNSQKITDLSNEYIKATDERRQAIEKEIATLQKRNEEIQKLKDMAQGKAFTAGELGEVTVTGSKMAKVNKDFREGGTSEETFSNYISSLKSAISQEDLGSEVFNNLTSKLQDATMMQTVLQQALASGASAVDMSSIAQEIKQKLLEGDIDDGAWQEFLEKINEKIQDADLKLTFDVDTKNITTVATQQQKDAQAMAKDWQAAGTAIQAVGSAMQQIEDPAAKVLGTIAQAIATMALSYAQAAASPAVTGTGWGWIAFAATGVATMLSSIAAIKNATKGGFASGGIVPGNSMSGDQLHTADYGINSGELILNRAQQGNLASQLEGGAGLGNLQLDTFIEAEGIRVVLNNNGRRTGRGEYVQSRNRRG